MGYYSIQDYVVYILILIVILWLLYKYLFARIKLDRDFLLASMPYVLVGILVRVLADAGVFPRSQWWSITPGIYVLAIGAGLVALAMGILLRRLSGVGYWVFPLIAGVLADGILIYHLIPHIKNPLVILYPVAIAAFLTGIVYLVSSTPKTGIFRKPDNIAIIFAHLLDGSASFYGIEYYGFLEEHLLPRLLIDFAGNAIIMIPLKLLVILIVLYLLESWYLEEEIKDETVYKMLKLVILILGIGPGLRNSILPSFQ
ncbi:MAG: DUF63 family protein [Candidatus Altiarchaeales archaeon]|nr:DUF63 family protein [Candidatus Altiarchaeota archaeon]MBU4265683.1 DUF63 family protein [Candidatus Altiarchaeota archaeon]MBU4341418.1 DUF63 family protein [Candidatus Altiarchaeota archaeon]MBU4436865.1 DUF63 family protein [Candidatus Altiarchaeota archaeon]MCG2782616.1 DUF63 family protein [Candidatus Altiarchaeales archaeon]